jgi:hypothetical protein
MSNCSNCGYWVSEGLQFCPGCGQQVSYQPNYQGVQAPPIRPFNEQSDNFGGNQYNQSYAPTPIKRSSNLIIIVVVVVVIILALVFSIFFLIISNNDDKGVEITSSVEVSPKITMPRPTEKSYAFVLNVAQVSGGSLELPDIKFQLIDNERIVIWEKFTVNANPNAFAKGASTIFALPSGGTIVTDSNTNSAVNLESNIEDYQNCSMVYIDGDSDGKVSEGDSVIIYKDPDSDGSPDVRYNYVFKIRCSKGLSSSITL